jgi:FKBP-type peptidyl-prolyl cis-trans isomerase
MKKYVCFLLFALGGLVLCPAESIAEDVENIAANTDVSYAFGMVIGSDLKGLEIPFNYQAFTRGFKQILEGNETSYSVEEAIKKVRTAFKAAVEKQMAKQAEENKAREQLFLEENRDKTGVVTTGSGLQYEVIAEGKGSRPDKNDVVRVNYEGSFVDGTVFDSSYERGESAEIPLWGVIPGWAEGLQLMREGGTYRFYIPSSLAYGRTGMENNVIPPYAVLIFKVELLEIVSTLRTGEGKSGDQP